MISTTNAFIYTTITLSALAQAQDVNLVGTWTTKSKKVITGPGFYNPVEDKFIEPDLTGISYSFTADGWYEEAYYRAISNPTQPKCPSAIMQFQHGRYTLPGNGSIILEPIEVDGRQQTSTPCVYTDTSLYTYYAQPELMSKYAVYTDSFHNVKRLDLYQFDGSPMHPMFLVYNPPMMLPTQTLNPTATKSATGATSTSTQRLRKRGFGEHFDQNDYHLKAPRAEHDPQHGLYIWWLGMGSIAVGTLMYLIPTSI